MKEEKKMKSAIRTFHVYFFIFSVLSVAALTSCMSPVTSGVSAEKGRLEFENAFFSSRIKIVEDKTVKLDSGFLKAQVTIRNSGKRDLNCQYRFIWKDKHDMTLSSAETLWLPLNLHGREERAVEAICPVPDAADLRLVIRPL